MKALTSTIALIITCQFLIAQHPVNYDDVGVIVNDNSQVSQDIGNYFQQKRNIPNRNMIHISAPATETIDSLTFEQIRNQIENYLTTQNLTDSFNFLVTTKGVPLKVQRANCDSISEFSRCSAFDSELTLMLGNDSSKIGKKGASLNPYYKKMEPFDREKFGIYLVTRLDGYSREDVFDLISRSGANQYVDQSTAKFVFDISSVTNPGEISYYTNMLEPSIDSLNARGWSTIFDPDTSLLVNQTNVLGYVGVNYNTNNEVLNYSWMKGALGYLLAGHSTMTFDQGNNPDNELLAANLVAEGISGMAGYITYIYAVQAIDNSILFNAYTDTGMNFTLAESYYMALPQLSWQHIVIGDPKTSITIQKPNSTGEPRWEDKIMVYPNPGGGRFKIESQLTPLKSIKVFNALGQQVYEETAIEKNFYFLDLTNQGNGTYIITLQTDRGSLQKKVLITE